MVVCRNSEFSEKSAQQTFRKCVNPTPPKLIQSALVVQFNSSPLLALNPTEHGSYITVSGHGEDFLAPVENDIIIRS
jgi:hypothetical protein